MYPTEWPRPLCWQMLFSVVSNATFNLYSFVCVFVVRWRCTYFFFCFVVNNSGQMSLMYSEKYFNILHYFCPAFLFSMILVLFVCSYYSIHRFIHIIQTFSQHFTSYFINNFWCLKHIEIVLVFHMKNEAKFITLIGFLLISSLQFCT